ncbi:Aspartate--tRNA ligase [Artemisia annua]|uniref:Aspartate--tRNA ligase n=1 Tax=Artemisia annua TaxID=35608 RepID=A0A2U1NVD3_ARTAN|nr:Aspartate--tRNA ligase [Artemisia annua]
MTGTGREWIKVSSVTEDRINQSVKESIVDIEGTVQFPDRPLTCASQQVEVLVRKIHCMSRSATWRPITVVRIRWLLIALWTLMVIGEEEEETMLLNIMAK